MAKSRIAQLVQDGWMNLATGLGDISKDKRKSAVLTPTILSYGEACAMYRGDKFAAKIVDIPTGEMVREWFDTLIQDDSAGRAAKVQDRLEELNTKARFKEALIAARKTGGAGILVGVDDGQTDGLKPLDPTKVKRVKYLMVADASELQPAAWYTDLNAPKYGEPMFYRVQPRMVSIGSMVPGSTLKNREARGIFQAFGGVSYVHESRVLPFYGVRLSRAEMSENLGWGDSVYNRLQGWVQDFDSVFGSVVYTLAEFSQGVLKMKGLAAGIAANGTASISNRLIALNLSKSVARTMLLDADGEDFTRQGISFSGIPETIDRLFSAFAAATDTPVALYFGQSPAGLNATGDSDIRWFYDQISAKQEEDLIPPAKSLVRMLLCEGGQAEPKKWSIKCRPLWQLDDTQEADRRLKIAQTDQIYIVNGVVTPEEVAAHRFGGAEYNPDKLNLIETDPAKRALAATENAEAEAELAAKTNEGKQPTTDEGDGTNPERP